MRECRVLEKVDWTDESSGLDCQAVRLQISPFAPPHWCGYVRIPAGHRLYCVHPLDESGGALVRVHGGVTYSGPRDGAGFWWGFDFAHYGDREETMGRDRVVRECSQLAADLAAIGAVPA